MDRAEAKAIVRSWGVPHWKEMHEHAIRAYAAGETIQYYGLNNGWTDISDPSFTRMDQYRVKPLIPEKVEAKGYVCIREHLGYKVGNIIGDGMVPLVPTNWKAFTTTVEV